MHARKVLEMGGGTFLVSLPKQWARKNGISKGDTLAVEEISGHKLLVHPIDESGEKPREFEIEFEGRDLRQVVNDLTGAYLLGHELIRIGGRRVIQRQDRATLKETIGRLVGLEIMDEDSKHITVQFLLESSVLDPQRIVRRMSGILEGMMRDTAEAVRKSDKTLLSLVEERDDEIDRLYFLLVRTIRSATIHPELAERYGLESVDVLDYRVLASFLESAGDATAELSKKLQGMKIGKRVSLEFSQCILMLTELDDLAIQSFLTRTAGRSAVTYSKIADVSNRISEELGRIAQSSGAEGYLLVEALGTFERISKLLIDISDLAMTTRSVQ